MRRKSRRLSIKTSLIVSFVGFNTGLLLLLYLVAANWYKGNQRDQMDAFLHTETSGIVSTIATFLNHDYFGNTGQGDPLQDPDFSDFLTAFLAQRRNSPAMYNTTLLISDLSGRLIAVSNRALKLDPRSLTDKLARIHDRKELEKGTELFSVEYDHLDYRVLQTSLEIDGQIVATIRLACLFYPVIKSTVAFLLLTSLFILFSLLINTTSGIFLVTRILSPIQDMNAVMNSITEKNLNSRLELLPGNDEVSTLAGTFNHTLDRIEKAYRSQEQLVSDLSHQLRTPLTSMRGAVELGMRKARSVEDYQAILEDNLVGIDRITGLVNTMLTLAKLDGHIESLRYESCDLVVLLEETIGELAPLWEEKAIRFRYRFRFYHNHRIEEFNADKATVPQIPSYVSDLFIIEADTLRFKQAIINLLDNAYKHTPQGGLISFELYREVTGEARFFRFVITNSGLPVPAADLPYLFTPFHQGSQPQGGTEDGVRGFGLGLSICRRIVEMHKGSIRAFNPVSGGAAFEIILPVKRTESVML
ncbi:MAG: ATP-binding protein [Planctomycetota bacterium]